MAKVIKDRRPFWFLAAGITLLVNLLFALNPQFTEIIYSRGIFQVLRVVYDYTLGLLPIPSVYVAIMGGVGLFAYRRYQRRGQRHTLRQKLGGALINILALLAAIYTLFYWSWGFNYQRVPVERQLSLPLIPTDSALLEQEFQRATTALFTAHQALGSPQEALTEANLPDDFERHMREALESQLKQHTFPVVGRVRGRKLFPQGTLMQVGGGTSGVYIPWVGEGHIEAALPPVSQPFTMAHELAHGYGFGDEGTCNFWGYLACMASDHPAVRYGGHFSYWRYVASQYRRLNPEAYQQVRGSLPAGINQDLQAIRELYRRYPGFFPDLTEALYNQYLTSNGVKGGIKSYSRVVELVMRYRVMEQKGDA